MTTGFEKRVISPEFNYQEIIRLLGTINLGKFLGYPKGKVLFGAFIYKTMKNGCYDITGKFYFIEKMNPRVYKYRSFRDLGVFEL